LLAAATAAKLETLTLLVDECRVNIHSTGDDGLGIFHHIKNTEKWDEDPNRVACLEFAESRGAKKQYIKWKDPFSKR